MICGTALRGVQQASRLLGIVRTVTLTSSVHYRSDLLHTTILMQDGLDIQELPYVIRKVDCFTILRDNTGGSVSSRFFQSSSGKFLHEREHKAVIEGFSRCSKLKDLLALLQTMPTEEVVPRAAVQALKKIVELENSNEFDLVRNYYGSSSSSSETFALVAVIKQLMEVIRQSANVGVLLGGLQCLAQAKFADRRKYQRQLCDELLVCAAEGKLTLKQTCDAVRVVAISDPDGELRTEVDKLWMGIVDKQHQIDENTITDVATCLSHFQKGQKLVFKVVENKVQQLWWKLRSPDIVSLLDTLVGSRCSSIRLLSCLSYWTSVNIHSLDESEVLAIVRSFLTLGFVDERMIKSLERYSKAKGDHMQDSALVAALAVYCATFRLRSTTILDSLASHFRQNAKLMSVAHISDLVYAFGHLNYSPENGTQFWQTLEELLHKKIFFFQPVSYINILLSCIYLNKFPLNLVHRVFDPFFVDSLLTGKDAQQLQMLRMKLKLLDTSMTMECKAYGGPMLQKDYSSKSLWHDNRITNCIQFLRDPLCQILGGDEKFSTMAVLSNLPLHEVYIVDILVHPYHSVFNMNLGLRTNNHNTTAILLHVPEHYAQPGDILIGLQALKHRQLIKMGFSVVHIHVEELIPFRKRPQGLPDFLCEILAFPCEAKKK